MKIIDPSVELITEENPLKRIELCGRVCYKSEDRITEDSADRFVNGIIKRGHTSVLEHSRFDISKSVFEDLLCKIDKSDKTNKIPGILSRIVYHGAYNSINARDFLAIGGDVEQLASFRNSKNYITARFICDRGISHELVRHRVFSFSQESTRYVNYKTGIEFIRPIPFEWAYDETDFRYFTWSELMKRSEEAYKTMISYGCKPQEARDVLPVSLKTEVVMTGTIGQWNEMLMLRIDSAAHPQMRLVAGMFKELAESKGYDFR